MRFVIVGPGAVGGTIAALLHDAGATVSVIARGEHLAAIRTSGLRLERPDRVVTAAVQAYGSAVEVPWTDDTLVLLAMKTQHAQPAVSALATAAPPSTPIVCTQNGLETERIVLRYFERTYAMCTRLPADHLEPGLVRSFGSPHPGVLDLGRYPDGADPAAESLAVDLRRAGFHVNVDPTVLRAKHRKLLLNLGNALDAICGRPAWQSELMARARAEAVALMGALGMEPLSDEEEHERGGDLADPVPIGELTKGGSSTWQSLVRGSSEVETDFLNGEIVSLGRQHGIPTPVNAAIQAVARRAAMEHWGAGSKGVEELTADIDAMIARSGVSTQT